MFVCLISRGLVFARVISLCGTMFIADFFWLLCQQPINFCPIFFFANHREDQVGQIVLWLFLLSLYIYFLPELAKEKANVQKKVEKPYQIKKKRKRRKKREKKIQKCLHPFESLAGYIFQLLELGPRRV